MKRYEVIEDNGGGLALAIFEDGVCVYYHSGFEYGDPGEIAECIASIDDWQYWDGNSDNPQDAYDSVTSYEYGWRIIADNGGVYPDRMGYAGRREFGVTD
jgi:hypothetical protein